MAHMYNHDDQKKALRSTVPEEFSDTQQYLPPLGTGICSTEEILRELLAPAGRYRSPFFFKDQALLQIETELLPLAPIAKDSFIVQNQQYHIPLRWKKIFDYLYREGIITYPIPLFDHLYNDEPKMYSVRLYGKKPVGRTDGYPGNEHYSRGASLDLEEALSKAVGELLERYPLLLYRNKELLTTSIRELRRSGKKIFDPFLLDQFSEWQKTKFPRYRFSEESVFRWVEGRSLCSGERAYIPAQLMFWNYQYMKEEPILQECNTNGAGGMFTKEEALLSGIYECVQRDGFFVYWLNSIAPPRVDTASIKNGKARKIIDACERYGLEVHILNTTSDIGVPSVVAVLLDQNGKGPEITLGSGCGTDFNGIIAHSLSEALAVRFWLRNGTNLPTSFRLPSDYKPFVSESFDLSERVVYWSNPGMQEKLRFFLKGPLRTMEESFKTHSEPLSPLQELKNVRDILWTKGARYEIFYYEARHPALDTLGYSSVSVAIPALLPVYLNEIKAPLGNPRIQEACRILGYAPAEEINQLPHPFP